MLSFKHGIFLSLFIHFQFESEFKNYGKGLRKILFGHGGQDKVGWAGHYGSKMAGACITLEIPETRNYSTKE